MVVITAHGGNCCGARHIYDFRNNVQDDIRQLERHIRENRNHLLMEVILSNRQATEKPQVIDKLQELGFVYSSSWVGNHGTPVHRFERTGRRLALNTNQFNWRGMTSSDRLRGDLPNLTDETNAGRNGIGLRMSDAQNNTLEVGDLVEIVGSTSRYNGQRFRITRFTRNYEGAGRNGFKAVFQNQGGGGGGFSIILGNLVRSMRGDNHNQNQQEIPQQLHDNAEVVQQEAIPVEPRVVFSTWHNNYRTTGRGAGFDTLLLAREAAPRCRRQDRRDIMSDETIVWVDNV